MTFRRLVAAALLWSFPALGATGITPASEVCTLHTDQQVIDAAIARYIDFDGKRQARYDRGGCAGMGGPPCHNPFPYTSYADFKAKNPSCCRVLTDIPGDIPLELRPNLRGEKEPRTYLVEMHLQAFRKGEDGALVPYLLSSMAIIDCTGEVVR